MEITKRKGFVGPIIPHADYRGTARAARSFSHGMVHWAGSYGLVALVAWLMVLAGHAGAWSIPALAIAALCAMLALLALFTHAFGRGRNGLYSFERAFALTACSALIIAGAGYWLGQGWSAAEAGRALDQVVRSVL